MLYSRFQVQARANPHKEALVCGTEALTFFELEQYAKSIARRLTILNVHKNSIVATSLPAGTALVATILAVYRLGACVLPLNPKFTDAELADYLDEANVQLVVADADEIERLSKLVTNAVFMDVAGNAASNGLVNPPTNVSAPALILFSSGSTGKAKQVVRSYQQLDAELNAFTNTALVDAADVFLCSVPLHHAHGFSNCFMASILNGAKLVIVPGEFNPRSVIKALEKHCVTVYPSATFMLKMLATIRVKTMPNLSQLRLVFTAGAPLATDIRESLLRALNISACQLYGSTEAGAMALNLGTAAPESVGAPLAGLIISIVNEDGNECPPGVEGEIVVNSPAAVTEYINNPQATEETFGDGRYRTGDIGYKNERGEIFITGRRKKMINVAGLKVDPAEVEGVLMRLDRVSEVVVLGKADSDYGEIVKAVVVADGLDESDVITHCKAHLAEYKWPKLIEFRNDMPRSPLGKILKKYL